MPERQMQDANLLQQRRLWGCKNQKWEGKKHRGGGAAADEEREFLSKGERGGKKGTTISTRNSPTTGDARETFFKKRKRKKKKNRSVGVSPCAVHWLQKASRARWPPSARGCSSRRFSELNQAGELAGH